MASSKQRSAYGRVARLVKSIKEDVFQAASRRVFERNGIAFVVQDRPECILRRGRHFSAATGYLACGACDSQRIFLYPTGIAWRNMMGASFALTTLFAYCHERTHALAGRRLLKPDAVQVLDYTLLPHVYIMGVSVSMLLYPPEGFERHRAAEHSSNDLLNEGLTESWARETAIEYLKLDPSFADVEMDELQHYMELLQQESALTFYPLPVRLVSTLSDVLGTAGTGGRQLLYESYFRCVDILHDPVWLERFARLNLTRAMLMIAEADLALLLRLERMLSHHWSTSAVAAE